MNSKKCLLKLACENSEKDCLWAGFTSHIFSLQLIFLFCLGIQLVIFLSVGMINLRENKLHLYFQIGWPKYLPRVREVSFPPPPFLCQSWGMAFLWDTGTFPQTWLLGSDLFPWGLFFPWPSFFPNHFIFLVPVYSWVYKAVGIVDRKGTWPNTYLDGWCFQLERLLW